MLCTMFVVRKRVAGCGGRTEKRLQWPLRLGTGEQHENNNDEEMKVLDLFSGIGGFSLGLERAGMKTIAFCEREPFCQAVLKKHWPDVPCHDDITTLDGRQYVGIDVICGGFPCQDISLAGTGKGLAGERSGLWFEYLRVIKEAQPRYVIIENVSALRSRGLDEVLRSLAEIGYDAEWHCIPASAIGAPHRRDRVWIVGYPNNNGQHGSKDGQSPVAGSNGNTQGANELVEPSGSSGEWSPDVANTEREQYERRIQRQQEELSSDSCRASGEFAGCGETLANTESEQTGRLFTTRLSANISASRNGTSKASCWAVEPDVGRVADGIPARVHRLKALGNSIVPQIAEIIGNSIMEYENDRAA